MRLRRTTPQDIPAITDLACAAFGGDELFSWLWPRQDEYPEDMRMFMLWRNKLRMVESGCVGWVAVLEAGDELVVGDGRGQGKQEGEIVGYAFWTRSAREGDEAGMEWIRDGIFNQIERRLLRVQAWYERYFLDRATDWQRVDQFRSSSNYAFYEQLGSFWHLATLGVSPEFQRRGVGTRLIEWGATTATAEGVPITLEGSLAGRQLYAKLGFKTFDSCKVAEGLEAVAMMWEPASLRGRWLCEDEMGAYRLRDEDGPVKVADA